MIAGKAMAMRYGIFLSLIAFLVLGLSSPRSQELVGWGSLEATISQAQSNYASKIESLNGQQFTLIFHGEAQDTIKIYPEEAFLIERTENVYNITIIDAGRFVENDGNFYKPVEVTWEVEVGWGFKSSIAIKGVNECVYNFTFDQIGGDLLDLSSVSRDYIVEANPSKRNILKTIQINGKSLLVERVENKNEDVEIELIIKELDGSEFARSKPIPVPKCINFGSDSDTKVSTQISFVEVRIAPQCITTLKQSTVLNKDNGKDHFIVEVNQLLANTCEREIQCDYVSRLVRAPRGTKTPALKGIERSIMSIGGDDGRVHLVSKLEKEIIFAPNSTEEIQIVHHNREPGASNLSYVWTAPLAAQDAVGNYGDSELTCFLTR